MFRNHRVELENVKNGFYYDLKEAILTSSTRNEYEDKIYDIFKFGLIKG
jgi:hypothetical protein